MRRARDSSAASKLGKHRGEAKVGDEQTDKLSECGSWVAKTADSRRTYILRLELPLHQEKNTPTPPENSVRSVIGPLSDVC